MNEATGDSLGMHQLYEQFKASKSSGAKPTPMIRKLVERIRPGSSGKPTTEQIRQRIVEQIRSKPGKYALADLFYSSNLTGEGFSYGFDYILGEDEFPIDYWRYNRWGILVQKHPSDYSPEIEVLGREDDRGSTLLHLPEGYKIPVGPLHFEDDSSPMSDKELASEKARAVGIAEKAGVKVSDNTIDTLDRLSGPFRKYPDRYFYWQPILPDDPAKIAIDFDKLNPRHMALTLEGSPVFNNTIEIKSEEL